MPEGTDVLESAFIVHQNKLVLKYLTNVHHTLSILDLYNPTRRISLPLDLGTLSLSGAERKQTEFFFKFTSFVHPGIVYHYDCQTEKLTEWKRTKVNCFDESLWVVEQAWVPSTGDVKIPIFMVRKRDLEKTSDAFCFVYGYGGFNISILPTFSPSWLTVAEEANGFYALPTLEAAVNLEKIGTRLVSRGNDRMHLMILQIVSNT